MVCVIGLVLAFGSSDKLAAAYGIAVAGTMVVTTGLLAVVARRLWHWSLPVTIGVVGCFLVVDLAFLGANAVKIPQGGWFPLVIGVSRSRSCPRGVAAAKSCWSARARTIHRCSSSSADLDSEKLPRVAGTAVYLGARHETVPYALADNLKHNKVLHERVVLLTVVTERVPSVAEAERMTLEAFGKGFTQMTLRFGFAEAPAVPAVLEAHRGEFPIDIAETSFFFGRELPVPKLRPDLPLWREKLYAFMTRNAVSAAAYFKSRPSE